jgi:hypothetical protein
MRKEKLAASGSRMKVHGGAFGSGCESVAPDNTGRHPAGLSGRRDRSKRSAAQKGWPHDRPGAYATF